jgi:outer membrane biogenesis lipoprotein LolB
MRPVLVLAMTCFILAACSSTEWVNVNNPKADYASDYRKCEEEGYNNPKFQGGMKMILHEHIDRCLKKAGWRLRQKRD